MLFCGQLLEAIFNNNYVICISELFKSAWAPTIDSSGFVDSISDKGKTVIRLCTCAGLSQPLIFVYLERCVYRQTPNL